MAKRNIIDLDELFAEEEEVKVDKVSKKVAKKNKFFFQPSVSYNKCEKCPLQNNCEYFDEAATTCGLTDAAVEHFRQVASRSNSVTAPDAILVQSVATIYASSVLAQKHFGTFGSIMLHSDQSGNSQYRFEMLHDQWLKLQKALATGLDALGMSPIGRKHLIVTGQSHSTINALTAYVQQNYDASDPNKVAKTAKKPANDPRKLIEAKEVDFDPFAGLFDKVDSVPTS